jgi:hypothetical protein
MAHACWGLRMAGESQGGWPVQPALAGLQPIGHHTGTRACVH